MLLTFGFPVPLLYFTQSARSAGPSFIALKEFDTCSYHYSGILNLNKISCWTYKPLKLDWQSTCSTSLSRGVGILIPPEADGSGEKRIAVPPEGAAPFSAYRRLVPAMSV